MIDKILSNLEYFRKNSFFNFHEFTDMHYPWRKTTCFYFDGFLHKLEYEKRSDGFKFKCAYRTKSNGYMNYFSGFEDEDGEKQFSELLDQLVIKHEQQTMLSQFKAQPNNNKKKVNKI